MKNQSDNILEKISELLMRGGLNLNKRYRADIIVRDPTVHDGWKVVNVTATLRELAVILDPEIIPFFATDSGVYYPHSAIYSLTVTPTT